MMICNDCVLDLIPTKTSCKLSNSPDAIRRLTRKGKLKTFQKFSLEERGTAMANFVLLYVGGGMPETEAEGAAVQKAWETWLGGLGSALVDAGNPFTPVAKSIASNGTISNGPLGTLATGYSIIKADSLDVAVKLAQGCPQLQSGGQISVYETFPVM
jgi:hypothetical protein